MLKEHLLWLCFGCCCDCFACLTVFKHNVSSTSWHMLRVPAPGWVCVLCRSEDVDSCGCHTCTHVQTVRGLACLVCVLLCFAWCRQFGHVDGHWCMRPHCSCNHTLLWLLLPAVSWHDSGPTLGPGWSTQPKAFEGRHCSFFCDGGFAVWSGVGHRTGLPPLHLAGWGMLCCLCYGNTTLAGAWGKAAILLLVCTAFLTLLALSW